MVESASEALKRAAERAQRRVLLENARVMMERGLGYEIAEEQAPWISILSHALQLDLWNGSCHNSGAPADLTCMT